MFVAIDKETKTEITVYAVSEDSCGYPKFLIRKDEQWFWKSAKYFSTVDEV